MYSNYVNSNWVPTCLQGGDVFSGEKWSLNLREKANNFEIPGGFQISKFKLHLYALEIVLPSTYIFLSVLSRQVVVAAALWCPEQQQQQQFLALPL